MKLNSIASRYALFLCLFCHSLDFLSSIGSPCWHELIIEDRTGSERSLLIACENQWIMKWAQRHDPTLTSPMLVIFFFLFSLAPLYWEINFILIWSYVSSITVIYLFSAVFFLRSHRIYIRNEIESDQANAIMRLNFFLPSSNFFHYTTWLLFRQASMNRKMVTFSDRKYWLKKIDA
jgi:hypothetical protein